MNKYVIAGLLVAGLTTPALAALLTMLGADGFKTKSEAESALKGMSECKA